MIRFVSGRGWVSVRLFGFGFILDWADRRIIPMHPWAVIYPPPERLRSWGKRLRIQWHVHRLLVPIQQRAIIDDMARVFGERMRQAAERQYSKVEEVLAAAAERAKVQEGAPSAGGR
jgi:hypothetical protein